jgi:hypothetical protein
MKRMNFYLLTQSEIDKLTTPENKELIDLLSRTCHEWKKTYFGQAGNPEIKTLTAKVQGTIITATTVYKRYSYRWHKITWQYAINSVTVTRHKLYKYL